MSTQQGGTDTSRAPGTAAVSVGSFSWAIDPVSGHLYPTSDAGGILLRFDGAVLHPSDDTLEPAARHWVRSGSRLLTY